tara:strand:+ start:15850 stop:17310 length:1461 start_codon:yes stop_codon:yes gene_type:complete
MSAKKLIATDQRRSTVNFRFSPVDGPNLPNQHKAFDYPEFRRVARRLADSRKITFAEHQFQIALRAVDSETPNSKSLEKEVELHFAVRNHLLKLRESFIVEKQKEITDEEVKAGVKHDPRLTVWWDKWVEDKKLDGKAKNTIANLSAKRANLFGSDYHGFKNTPILGESFRIEDYDQKKTARLIVQKLSDRFEGNTLFGYNKVIKQFFKWLVKEGELPGIGHWPTVKEPEPYSDPYSKEELLQLKELCEKEYQRTGDKTLLRAWYIFRYTGCRRSEAVQIRIDELEFKSELRGSAIIHKTKTGANKQPLLCSNPELLRFIKEDLAERGIHQGQKNTTKEVYWLDNGKGKVVWGVENFTERFKQLRNQIGSKVKSPIHGFRHAVANEIYEITGDINLVRIVLRHKLLKTTQRYLNSARVQPLAEDALALLGTDFVRETPNADIEVLHVPRDIEEQIAFLEAKLRNLYAIRQNAIPQNIQHSEPKLIN